MERRQNYSRKREAILKIVQGTKVHPSAEWVYHELKPSYPDLSLGTVYRNLSQFKNDGVIVSVGTVNGQERFDGATYPHSHFVCDKCGCVLDVEDSSCGSACAEISERYGVTAERCDVVFRGTCAACEKKERKA
ncbi:MAG TPA: transcriptional repressor [Candidatus Caccousia avicola]|uniref:Transcriptional repressor n=1 Tax=Candidatus Caccousia avicola TaxID=2840721 RepID=A0A9D1AMB4_9FIRM|nr:transcriptional repressor [Candidatus Caccousia avicola]